MNSRRRRNDLDRPHDTDETIRDDTSSAKVKLPSDCEIVITCTFNASRTVVFDAWTKAEHIPQWCIQVVSRSYVCEIDPRPNGIFRFVHQGLDGPKYSLHGHISRNRTAHSARFHDADPSVGRRCIGPLIFDEHDGKMTLTVDDRVCLQRRSRRFAQMRIDGGAARTLDNRGEYLGAKA